MKIIQTLALSLSFLSFSEAAEQTYHPTWDVVKATKVSSIQIIYGSDAKTFIIEDPKMIKELMSLTSKKDFPVTKGPLCMSLPGVMCEIKFFDATSKKIRGLRVYAAWNLLQMRNKKGKVVLGSNKALCANIFAQLEKNDPHYTDSLKELYKAAISGVFDKEYRDSF